MQSSINELECEMADATFTALPRYITETGATSKWEVFISYDHPKFPGCYGYFEHDEQGEGGGLWFERIGNGKRELTDYDGRSTLPIAVFRSLVAAGFVVADEFRN